MNLSRALTASKRRGLMQGYNFPVLSAMSNPESAAATTVPEAEPLSELSAALVRQGFEEARLLRSGGALIAGSFADAKSEIDALFHSAAVLDLGWRGKIAITGSDRLRWLNGMASNAIEALPQNEGNYNFLLNAQGRIQGDGYIYRRDQDLLLDTARGQISPLMRHLDHYIIMDDVELKDVSSEWTALAIAGPTTPQILTSLGIDTGIDSGRAAASANLVLSAARVAGADVILVRSYHVLIPRYELWFAPQHVMSVWEAIKAAGATPAGLDAAEVARVLEGVPLYGVDIGERDLPQETSQTRALNFHKGCYLGQEIVERIRSRAKVHRQFRQFALEGTMPSLPCELTGADQPAGRITSAITVRGSIFALGVARVEALEGRSPLTYPGGVATPLDSPPPLRAL